MRQPEQGDQTQAVKRWNRSSPPSPEQSKSALDADPDSKRHAELSAEIDRPLEKLSQGATDARHT